jgi:hypothetical protein
MSHSHSTNTHPDPNAVTEKDAIDAGSIVRYAVGLTLVVIAAHLAMLWMYSSMSKTAEASTPPRIYPLAADEDSRRPPEPRLQGGVQSDSGRLLANPPEHNPGPKEALRELRAEEDVILNGYEWVDRNAKVVRIPITEAMKLTLQRGLPARDAAAAQSATTQGTQEPSKEGK